MSGPHDMKSWKDISLLRKIDLIRLLSMEAEGGGWIPDDLWEENEEEAEAQVEAIQAVISFLYLHTPGLREAVHTEGVE